MRIELASNYLPEHIYHMECVVLGNQPMFSGLASVCANVYPYGSLKKVAKPYAHVAQRPEWLTDLFTCGIVGEALIQRILIIRDRK